MFLLAGWEALAEIKAPFRSSIPFQDADLKAVEREAGRIADAVVVEQCVIQLRARDMADIYRDPERMSQERVWSAYERGVAAVAWAQGTKEAEFVAKWKRLIVSRLEAEEDDDDREVQRIDARLLTLVGIPHPTYPEAAWTAADSYLDADRQAEYDRLEAKYGPRNPSANGIGAKTRGRRETRALTLTH
jgi:hypothetical protein